MRWKARQRRQTAGRAKLWQPCCVAVNNTLNYIFIEDSLALLINGWERTDDWLITSDAIMLGHRRDGALGTGSNGARKGNRVMGSGKMTVARHP